MALLFIIALGTLLFSFGVQCFFFLVYAIRKDNLLTKYRHVFGYSSGVIGDGVLVPLSNVFSYLLLLEIGQSFELGLCYSALIFGFFISFWFHYVQRHLSLTNWTMPKVGQWNSLGLYHICFMFFESSILSYVLLASMRYAYANGLDMFMFASFRLLLLTLILFFFTLLYDYRYSLFQKVRSNSLYPTRQKRRKLLLVLLLLIKR